MTTNYGRGTITLTPSWPEEATHWQVTPADGSPVVLVPLGEDSHDTYTDALAVLGLKRPCQANKALYVLRSYGYADTSDPWGDGMTMVGAVCDLLSMLGEEARIPADMGYHRSPYDTTTLADVLAQADAWTEDLGGDIAPELCDLARAHRDGEVSTDDLATAARILSRYLDMVKAAGLDY